MTGKQKSRPTPIASSLEVVLRSLGISKKYHGWQVVSNWSQIMGEYNATHAPAVRFQDGVLYIEIADAAKRADFSMQIDEIMDTIHQQSYGRAVKQLRFVSGRKEI